MKVEETYLDGVLVIHRDIFHDSRGYFLESFQKAKYQKIGIDYDFCQDNLSLSKKSIVRGLHFQNKKPQGKLVSCLRGAVYDVVVDINPRSKNFCKYFSIELSDKNNLQLWIPPGYAHGFCSIEDNTLFHYKCTDYFDSEDEGGIIWNDPDINIDWPIKDPVVSAKDMRNKSIQTLGFL